MSIEKNLILYGIKMGEKYEDIIVETDKIETIERAKAWAKNNNYEKLRFWKYNGGKPDFIKTITF